MANRDRLLQLTDQNLQIFRLALFTLMCDRQIDFDFQAIELTLLAHDEQKWNILSKFTLQSLEESL